MHRHPRATRSEVAVASGAPASTLISAPGRRRASSMSRSRTPASTRAPRLVASWTVKPPTIPAAPVTSTTLPSCTVAASTRSRLSARTPAVRSPPETRANRAPPSGSTLAPRSAQRVRRPPSRAAAQTRELDGRRPSRPRNPSPAPEGSRSSRPQPRTRHSRRRDPTARAKPPSRVPVARRSSESGPVPLKAPDRQSRRTSSGRPRARKKSGRSGWAANGGWSVTELFSALLLAAAVALGVDPPQRDAGATDASRRSPDAVTQGTVGRSR